MLLTWWKTFLLSWIRPCECDSEQKLEVDAPHPTLFPTWEFPADEIELDEIAADTLGLSVSSSAQDKAAGMIRVCEFGGISPDVFQQGQYLLLRGDLHTHIRMP